MAGSEVAIARSEATAHTAIPSTPSIFSPTDGEMNLSMEQEEKNVKHRLRSPQETGNSMRKTKLTKTAPQNTASHFSGIEAQNPGKTKTLKIHADD